MADQTPKHIDIGGGTDTPNINSPSYNPEQELRSMKNLRAVQLAVDDPEGTYVVVDPNIATDIAQDIRAEVPNVHWVVGSGDRLPLREATATAVEINHLFYPLFMKDLEELEQQGEDHEKLKALFEERLQQLDDPTTTLNDFSDYFSMVTEAADALQPGGTLLLAEKKSNTDTVQRILLNTEAGQELLVRAGLEVQSIEPNTQEHPSVYAQRAAHMHGYLTESGRPNAPGLQPMILTLTKL